MTTESKLNEIIETLFNDIQNGVTLRVIRFRLLRYKCVTEEFCDRIIEVLEAKVAGS